MREAVGSWSHRGSARGAAAESAGRLLHVDDDELDRPTVGSEPSVPPNVVAMPERRRVCSGMPPLPAFGDQHSPEASSPCSRGRVDLMWSHPQVRAELAQPLVETRRPCGPPTFGSFRGIPTCLFRAHACHFRAWRSWPPSELGDRRAVAPGRPASTTRQETRALDLLAFTPDASSRHRPPLPRLTPSVPGSFHWGEPIDHPSWTARPVCVARHH